MKRASLFLTAILTASLVYGQQGNNGLSQPVVVPYNDAVPPKQVKTAERTTTTVTRWYNYGGQYKYWDWDANTSVSTYSIYFPFLWFDTSSQNIYPTTPVLRFNHLVSYGQIFQPWAPGFNDTNFCGIGATKVTRGDSYTIDSVEVVGYYKRNSATSSSIYDTLRISLVSGDGIAGNIVLSTTLPVPGTVIHDSLYNVADNANTWDIVLGPTDVIDTDAAIYRGGSRAYTGFVHKRIPIPGGFIVPAGHYTGMTVTFKSGDPSAPHMPFGSPGYGDTVYTGHSGNPYKYGMFLPHIAYHTVLGTGIPGTADWPEYDTADFNAGIYRHQPDPGAGGRYIWMHDPYGTTTGLPGRLQMPALGFHVLCVSCGLTGFMPPSLSSAVYEVTDLNALVASPNPADGMFNISFTQADGTTATVTLTNMLGQVVANQVVSNGKAVINTADLSAGLYIYSVQSEGSRVIGRVVVAH